MTMSDLALNIAYDSPSEKKKKKNSTNKKRRNEDPGGSIEPAISKKRKFERNQRSRDEQVESGGQISSLFGKNPEIPLIEHKDITPISEPLFSKTTFTGLGSLHPYMVSNLEQNFGVTDMTTVQKLSIPVLLNGKDALVRSQTGSGKTLAYAIPILQKLQEIRPKLNRGDGIRALVVLPTRELALQTYECFVKLVRSFAWLVPGLLVGGEKRKSEKARLRKGLTILIGTPGRLIDHTNHTKSLKLSHVNWLILDEGDMLLNMNYEKEISSLVETLKAHRSENESAGPLQTVLLSATLTPAVKQLAGLTLKDPKNIDASKTEHQEDDLIIPHSLKQAYVITPAKLRLVTLASFIVRKCEVESVGKMLIFMATQDMVDYYTSLLSTVMTTNAEFFKLHGNMTQSERTDVFKAFRSTASGILVCTDVAARGLDLPNVDWIVQFTAPLSPAEYVHRVGRTARVGSKGSALLFLVPSELQFIDWLNDKRISIEEESMERCLESLLNVEMESPEGQVIRSVEFAASVLQMNFEKAVVEQKSLHELASKAYTSWVRFYASYPKEARKVFHFKSIHLGHFAKSFALRDAPTSISGIGKPKHTGKKFKIKQKRSGPPITDSGKTRKLIVSEFESGLKPLKKK